nr:RNA methyltransferase [Leucobacter exalbidus]
MSNPKSTRVKRVAALSRKKERVEQGRFLVEGPQAVRELLTHRADLAEVVFATQGDEPWQAELKTLAEQAGVYLDYVSDSVLAAMSETVNPQGIVAVATTWEGNLTEALKDARLVVIMHEVRDPGNAGAVLRAADAAGADVVIFAGESIDPFHPKVVRSTTGSMFHLPVEVTLSLEEAVTAVREAGLTSLAADVRGSDVLEARADGVLAGRVAWVFGNEARGLSEAERALVDRSLKLPIYGAAESLNLATAASVLIYETAFAQRA